MLTDLASRPFPFTCHVVKRTHPRRLFFSVFGLIGFIIITGNWAVNASDDPDWRVRVYFVAFAAPWVLALFLIPFEAGLRHVLPNRIVTLGGATWIVPKFFPVEQLIRIAWAAAPLASGAVLTVNAGPALLTAGAGWIAVGPGFIVLGLIALMDALRPLMRGIKLTPDAITYWRGCGRVTVGWGDLGDAIPTDDVRDRVDRRLLAKWMEHGFGGLSGLVHRKLMERHQWYTPGVKIVIPVEPAEQAPRRAIEWEDGVAPRLLVEVDYLIVEPSALITAILALRDRPELRTLLGTRASKSLFIGPPWRVRRHMYRTQQWWPSGAAPDGTAVDRDGVVKEFQ